MNVCSAGICHVAMGNEQTAFQTGRKQSIVHAELAENTSNDHAKLAENTSNVHAELAENTFNVHSERAENSPMSTLNRPKTRLMSMPNRPKTVQCLCGRTDRKRVQCPCRTGRKQSRASSTDHQFIPMQPHTVFLLLLFPQCLVAGTRALVRTHTHTLTLAQRRQLLDLFHVLHDRLAFKAGGS